MNYTDRSGPQVALPAPPTMQPGGMAVPGMMPNQAMMPPMGMPEMAGRMPPGGMPQMPGATASPGGMAAPGPTRQPGARPGPQRPQMGGPVPQGQGQQMGPAQQMNGLAQAIARSGKYGYPPSTPAGPVAGVPAPGVMPQQGFRR